MATNTSFSFARGGNFSASSQFIWVMVYLQILIITLQLKISSSLNIPASTSSSPPSVKHKLTTNNNNHHKPTIYNTNNKHNIHSGDSSFLKYSNLSQEEAQKLGSQKAIDHWFGEWFEQSINQSFLTLQGHIFGGKKNNGDECSVLVNSYEYHKNGLGGKYEVEHVKGIKKEVCCHYSTVIYIYIYIYIYISLFTYHLPTCIGYVLNFNLFPVL